jgi:myo-inositol catabolism protein IolC
VRISKQLENLHRQVTRRINYDTISAFDDVSKLRDFIASLALLAAANEDAFSLALRLRAEMAVTEAELDSAKQTFGEAMENCSSMNCRNLVRDVRTMLYGCIG